MKAVIGFDNVVMLLHKLDAPRDVRLFIMVKGGG